MPRNNHHDTRRPQRRKDVLHARGGHRGDHFRCASCRLDVPLAAPGTAHRNHCPHCLTSLHVDRKIPGDRAANCRGRMDALGIAVRPDGEWLLVHRCAACAALSTNRPAADDNPLSLLRLALAPLTAARTAGRALLTP
ncbi:RNHCP domain-containing protein [Streptomyces termitum]